MLISNWRAWSVRLILIIGLLQGLDVAMPLVGLFPAAA